MIPSIKTRGQTIAGITAGIGLVVAALGGWLAQNRILDNKIESAKEVANTANIEVIQRVATLEEAISTMKETQKEQGQDIKAILRAVRQ